MLVMTTARQQNANYLTDKLTLRVLSAAKFRVSPKMIEIFRSYAPIWSYDEWIQLLELFQILPFFKSLLLQVNHCHCQEAVKSCT